MECPVDPIDETREPYDVVAEATTPPVRSASPVATATTVDPGTTPVQTLQYRSAPTGESARTDPETLTNFHIPMWLLACGVAIEVVAALLQQRRGFERALTGIGVQLVLGTAIMLAGVLIAAKFRGIALGSFWTACLKLAAISIAPGAAGILFGSMLSIIPLSGLLVWVGEFVLYFALLGLLFDLDQSDTWYCVCVIFVLNVCVYFALLHSGLLH